MFQWKALFLDISDKYLQVNVGFGIDFGSNLSIAGRLTIDTCRSNDIETFKNL
jgi:hypothetical protein